MGAAVGMMALEAALVVTIWVAVEVMTLAVVLSEITPKYMAPEAAFLTVEAMMG